MTMAVNGSILFLKLYYKNVKLWKKLESTLRIKAKLGLHEFTSVSCENNLLNSSFASRKCFLKSKEFNTVRNRKFHKWHRFQSLEVLNYMKSLKWIPMPLGVGFGYIAYQQYQHLYEKEEQDIYLPVDDVTDWMVIFYRLIPLRTISRIWGWLNDLDLPLWARKPLYNLYASTFRCNLEEAEIEDLLQFKNLGEFFRRNLKPSARQIHPGDCLISPADGIVMNCGLVNKNYIEQIKGVTYAIDSFLGINKPSSTSLPRKINKDSYHKALLEKPDEHELYYYIVYLAPGDYHRFHSPVDWELHFRRHFTGDLLSVKPRIAQWIPCLFTLNERAAYIGRWKYGFFSMTPVGATLVGSIKIYKDEELRTNCKKLRKGACRNHSFSETNYQGMPIRKGEPFGEFNLGSTIVLIFEAPRNYQFHLAAGDRVQVGQALNVCHQHREWKKINE